MKNKTFIKRPENIEDLWPLVVEECRLIKQNFSEEQIDKLEVELINGNSATSCVYGIMTGDCNSTRVSKFIRDYIDTLVMGSDIKAVQTEDYDILDETNTRSCTFTTPMEEYIYEDYSTDDSSERIKRVVSLLKSDEKE